MSRHKINPLVIKQFDAELERTPHTHRSRLAADWAARLGVSSSTLYRHRARVLGPKKRITRGPEIPQQMIDEVARLKQRLARLSTDEREYSTERCIAILEHDGTIPRGVLSVTTANRRLRESGYRADKIIRRIEVDFANQEWQLDFSRTEYFQVAGFDDAKEDYIIKVSPRHLRYKENNKLRTLWLAQVKDSYSRARLIRGYVATGESALLGLEFLSWAIQRQDDGHPMRGLPVTLKTDQGAFHKSEIVKNAALAMGIDLRASKPYNKDSQGKVERGFRSVWAGFELDLIAKYGESLQLTLTDYNDLIHEYLADELDLMHPFRRTVTRREDYRSSLRQVGLRTSDADIMDVAARVYTRTIDASLCVWLDNVGYQVPYTVERVRIERGMKIRLYRNAEGRVMGQLVDEHTKAFELAEFRPHGFDDYEGGPPASYKDRIRTLLDREARKPKGPEQLINAALPTPEETVEAKSPFAAPQEEDEPTELLLTNLQARELIGRSVQPYGLSGYADIADLIDPHLQREEITKNHVQELIAHITDALDTNIYSS